MKPKEIPNMFAKYNYITFVTTSKKYIHILKGKKWKFVDEIISCFWKIMQFDLIFLPSHESTSSRYDTIVLVELIITVMMEG
jgi:hypothetical protein